MKRMWTGELLLCIMAFGLIGFAYANDTDKHQVTVQVNAINEVAVEGGDITLVINSATAGQDPDQTVDNTSCDLKWTTNEASKKITVQSSLGSPTFTLKVVAQNVAGGMAAAEVTLGTTASDFVTSVSTTTGSCDLQYTASATASAGTGSDVHTVTYTITGS